MKGNPLFIVDDEADASSLNTLVNRNRQSLMNKYLNAMNEATSSIYLQVTGAPQVVFLQTISSGWRPYFTYYLHPGDGYLDGEFFFPTSEKPSCIESLETIKMPTHDVILQHLTVSSQIFSTGGMESNCLFYPSVRQADHQRYADEIAKELPGASKMQMARSKNEMKEKYEDLTSQKPKKTDFEIKFAVAKELLTSCNIKVLKMNEGTT